MKLQRKPPADNWSLSADTKLLLMRTTAGDLFSSLLQHVHTNTHLHPHTGEENILEHKGQSRTETSRGRQEVKIEQWNKSTLALLWKVRSLWITLIIPIFTQCQNSKSSSTLWTGFGSHQVYATRKANFISLFTHNSNQLTVTVSLQILLGSASIIWLRTGFVISYNFPFVPFQH